METYSAAHLELFIYTPTSQVDSLFLKNSMNKNQANNITKNKNIVEQILLLQYSRISQERIFMMKLQLYKKTRICLQVPIQKIKINYNLIKMQTWMPKSGLYQKELNSIISRQGIVSLKLQTQPLHVIVQVQVLKSQLQHVKPILTFCFVDVMVQWKDQVKESLRYIEVTVTCMYVLTDGNDKDKCADEIFKITKIYQDELLWKESQQGKYETGIQYLLDNDYKL